MSSQIDQPSKEEQSPKVEQSSQSTTKLKLYEAIVNRTVDGIVVFNEEFNVIFANDRAGEILRLDKDEIRGKELFHFIPPDVRSKHEKLTTLFSISSDTKQEMPDWRTVKCQRFDGTEFPAKITINKYPISEKMIFIASILDMSDLLDTEAEKRTAELICFQQEQLQKYTNEVLKMNLEAPVNLIAKTAQSIKGIYTQPQIQKSMAEIVAHSFSALSICQRALFFSSQNSRTGELKLVDQTLKGTIDRIKVLFEDQIKNKKITINWHLPAEAKDYKLQNCQTIEQIFYNIIEDSIETAEKDTLEVKITNWKCDTQERLLSFSFSCYNENYGVPQHMIEQLVSTNSPSYLPFFIDHKYGGMCLRLAKNLTDELNGEFKLTSHPVSGTNIVVHLEQPLKRASKTQASA